MVAMSHSDNEDLLIQQIKKDNLHFKGLLNLVPPQFYFSREEKLEVFGADAATVNDKKSSIAFLQDHENSDEEDGTVENEKKKRKYKVNPFTTLSVTDILELKQRGGLPGSSKQTSKSIIQDGTHGITKSAMIAEKHKNKKLSRQAKNNKSKGKEIDRRETRLEELKEKLSKKLEEIKAKKNSGTALNTQELKKLKRQEKKVNAKLKTTNKTIKTQKLEPTTEGLKSPPHKQIVNQNGEPVKSKFDFSVSFSDKDNSRSNFRGRDYKRLLEKVEKRQEKIDKLKENDLEAGKKLETKYQWQAALSKAKGEKVKDDPNLLKKAAKRKDKIKEKKKHQWDGRVKTVEELKQKRQQKRQTNIDKRKNEKKDKKRKKMIKKGRIIPGF